MTIVSSSKPPPEQGKPWRLQPAAGSVGAFVLVVILAGFTALFSLLLVDQYERDWQQAEVAATNLGSTVRRDILQSFHSADQALLSVRELLRVDSGFAFNAETRRALGVFGDTAGEIYILDTAGNVVLGSNDARALGSNFANQRFFYEQARATDDRLITAGTVSLTASKDPLIFLSRRLTSKQGKFTGVAAFAVRFSGFKSLFQSLDLGERGAIAMFSTDGTLLLRAPGTDIHVGTSYITSPVFWKIATTKEPFVAVSAIDGVERLFNSSHVGELPLIVSIGLSVDEIHAGWRRQAITTSVAFFLLAAGVVFLSIMLGRELRLRGRNELRYRTLAHVDGLTGLFNRRQFDSVLDAEFSQAEYLQTPMSVIMIDVDRFKLFNDRYGHQSGDDCLKRIADAVQLPLKRTKDVAARYGGEELVIVLPETDEAGSAHIAESVRLAIEALQIAHEGSHVGVVTASIGVATFDPANDGVSTLPTPAALIAAADEALYAAKRSGRNRIVTHRMVQNGVPGTIPENEALRAEQVEAAMANLTPNIRSGLDQVTRMASRAFGTEMSTVTLVDATHQHFAGKTGVRNDCTGRDLSFCAHVLDQAETMVVLDAKQDIRFSGNGLVTGEPHVRFYAGAPLIDDGTGTTLGTLCILDQKPKASFSDEERELLMGFAALAMEQLRSVLPPAETPVAARKMFKGQ